MELTFQRPTSADSYSFSIDGIDDEDEDNQISESFEEKKQDSPAVPSKKNRSRRARSTGVKISKNNASPDSVVNLPAAFPFFQEESDENTEKLPQQLQEGSKRARKIPGNPPINIDTSPSEDVMSLESEMEEEEDNSKLSWEDHPSLDDFDDHDKGEPSDARKRPDSRSSRVSRSSRRSRKKAIRFAETNQVHHFTPSPAELYLKDHEYDDFFSNTPCSYTLRNFLAVYVLPFLYGASHDVTTLYFFVEMSVKYGIHKNILGIYLVAAYLVRIVASGSCRIAPKTSSLIGTMVACAGFYLVYLSQTLESNYSNIEQINEGDEGDDFNITFDNQELTLFLLGSILANSNETIGAMRIFLRNHHPRRKKIKTLGLKLRDSFVMAKIARVSTFSAGGILYQVYGLEAVSLLGVGLVGFQFLCLVLYLVLDGLYCNNGESADGTAGVSRLEGDMEEGATWIGRKSSRRKSEPGFSILHAWKASAGRRRLITSSMSKLNRTLNKYYPCDIPPSVLRYALPLCLFGKTLSHTCIWVSSVLIMKDDFDRNYITIGAVLAGGAFSGLISSLLSLSTMWNFYMRKRFPAPRNIYSLMIGLILSTALVAYPLFVPFVIGFIFYGIFHAMLENLLIELAGTSTAGGETIFNWFLRRIWIAGTLYALPILYELHPRLPFVLAFWFAFMSTMFLIIYIHCHSKEEVTVFVENKMRDEEDNAGRRKRKPSTKPERNLGYTERVTLGLLIKGDDL